MIRRTARHRQTGKHPFVPPVEMQGNGRLFGRQHIVQKRSLQYQAGIRRICALNAHSGKFKPCHAMLRRHHQHTYGMPVVVFGIVETGDLSIKRNGKSCVHQCGGEAHRSFYPSINGYCQFLRIVYTCNPKPLIEHFFRREIVRQLELEQQTHRAVREEADRNLELVLAQENQLKDLHAQKHVLEQEIETLNKKLGEAGIFSALRQIEQQSLFERNMVAFLAEMKVKPRSLLKDEIKDLDLFIGQKYAKERKAHPGMTVTDWRYWLLTRMEFSNENMAILMNVRIDSVYKQKQRVKEHLNQKNKSTSKS